MTALVLVASVAAGWYFWPGVARHVARPAVHTSLRSVTVTHNVDESGRAVADSRAPGDASAPALEDEIARAMPAIVLIETSNTSGSGFFVAPDLVVTSAHVLAGASSVSVTVHDDVRLDGRTVASSDEYDVAVVQIPAEHATSTFLPLAHNADLRLGQNVVAIEWAQTLKQSAITRGVVTGLRHAGERYVVQTDAVPNSGDSGGALLDRFGRVVGVTTARANDGTAGFAVAVDHVRRLLEGIPQGAVPAAATARSPSEAGTVAPTVDTAASRPSELEARRTIGAQHYDDSLASIVTASEQLDASWNHYKSSCHITSVLGGQSHEWFALYDPQSPLHRTSPNCARPLAAIEDSVRAVDASMAAASEVARRDGVFAGDLRALRAKHKLDYGGWDR